VGVVLVLLEGDGELGETGGDIAGDAGTAAAGVEVMGGSPDEAEAFPDIRAFEVVQENAVAAGRWEGDIGAAGAGEFRVKFKGVPDVYYHKEGRAAFGGREGSAVLFGLASGAEHGVVPGGGPATGGAKFEFAFEFAGSLGKRFAGVWSIGALFGLKDEATLLVEVHASSAGSPVAVLEHNSPFEDVGILRVVGTGGIWAGDADEIA
jgi:hypothetical protein